MTCDCTPLSHTHTLSYAAVGRRDAKFSCAEDVLLAAKEVLDHINVIRKSSRQK